MRHILGRFLIVALAAALVRVGSERLAMPKRPLTLCVLATSPGAPPAQAGPWAWEYAYHTVAFDDCRHGGGFGLSFPNQMLINRVSTAALRLERPATGPKSSIAIRRVRLWLSARLAGTGSFLYVVTTASTTTSGTQTDVFGPPGGNTLASPVLADLPLNTNGFRVVLACSGSSGDDCHPVDRRPLEIQGTEVTLEEYVSPELSVTGGTLVAGGSQSGGRTVTFVARDSESGVERVESLLGDTIVGSSDFRSACSYSDFAACPAAKASTMSVDTRAVSDGTYPLRLRVTDAAGNATMTQSSVPIRVANGSAARLTARFDATSGRTLTSRYGTRIAIRGRLTDSAGRPISNARIKVQERLATAGATTGDRVDASTNADGRWRYNLQKKVSSRDLRFSHGASSKSLRLRVRAASVLRVSLRGHSRPL